MGQKITDHFDVEEFRCHDGSAYPPEWVEPRLRPLCDVLEALRVELGGPSISILSGYRSPAHNASLRDADGSGTGVAQNSKHMTGEAADIVVKGCKPAEVHAALLRLDASGRVKIGGLGIYVGWVHVDVRERPADGHLAQWSGVPTSTAAVA